LVRGKIIKLRQNRMKLLIAPFQRLLDFVNQPLVSENWRVRVWQAMGEEKSCYVTYLSLEGPRRAKMLEADICSNLQLELFGTSVVFDPEQSRREIAKAIIKIEDCLPQISGQEATLESAQALQKELKKILQELIAENINEPQEQISLIKKIEKAFGGQALKREAFLFPDGEVFYKSWLLENQDLRLVLFFDLARLVNELCPQKQTQLLVITPEKSSRAISMKIVNGIMAERMKSHEHWESAKPTLKLSICGCGCQGFFLQSGERARMFINDQHRMKFHNTERTRTGANAEAVRRHRLQKIKVKRPKPENA